MFVINSYSPYTMVEDLIKVHEGKVENGLVTFETSFANGAFKYVDYNYNMVAIINNIQYTEKTKFSFVSKDTEGQWITLLYNSQSCILILDNVLPRKVSHNNHGSFIEFNDENVGWQPTFDVDSPIKTIMMFISVKWFEEIGMFPEESAQLRETLEKEGTIKFIHIEKHTVDILAQVFDIFENKSNHPLLNKKLEGYLWTLASDTLYNNFNLLAEKRSQTIHSESEQVKIRIMAVKDEMLRTFSKSNLDLDYWARVAGMNRTKFQQAFKDIFNVSFYKYYQEARFNEALRLLEFESYTTTSVAAAIGYKNVGYFIKEFQKRFGVTPNEYRTKNVK